MQATPAVTTAPRWRRWWRLPVLILALLLLLILLLMWWWDKEPARYDVVQVAREYANANQEPVVTGTVTAVALIHTTRALLDKRGGYLANDVLPPGVFMDNMPNWEQGVVLQARDLAQAFRNEFSRSQTQSVEDKDLQLAYSALSNRHNKWLFPSYESQLRDAAERVEDYLKRLSDDDLDNAQFYARADNLVDYLALVEKRLGSLSQRLSASVGQERINTDLAGDRNAQQSRPAADEKLIQTPWLQIDDVFYEARGTTWALAHYLRAVEIDFGAVLVDKNATVSLRQIIRELDESQGTVWSPMILNGSKYGFFANHSLVMANYVSRANAAVIELRHLLERG